MCVFLCVLVPFSGEIGINPSGKVAVEDVMIGNVKITGRGEKIYRNGV